VFIKLLSIMTKEIEVIPKQEGKGRTFRVSCLSYINAQNLTSSGDTDMRPVWAMFAGSENEVRPFMANLISGRKLRFVTNHSRRNEERLEFLKSYNYRISYQREPEGVLATVFIPEFFRLDPGMIDIEEISFIMLPSQEWSTNQKLDTKPLVEYGKLLGYTEEQALHLAPQAYLFAAYLDRRSRCPLIADGRFYLQLFMASLKEGLASWSLERYGSEGFGRHKKFRFDEYNTREVGLLPGVIFRARQSVFEEFLAQEVNTFFKQGLAKWQG
jgi:hypothetical protein